ncbi:hypothetical protein [Actinophytocola algeriensis]|uniref:Uncharacterized protein n=1 Tax=Actinophytocola algeriensis TaxID=1768010 RepID=A0A7W7VF79_9PSEU|nr:hypothetical protein [Actinophytocola algeriensis]MBB4908053.1 hypothetical protein [Actinophytocola algeriensis]MBE1480083.1 hypothetical protein [Actinophytocola algeriensis]
MNDEIDRELIGIFEFRKGAAERLAKLGPSAFDRVVHLYHSTELPPRLSELGSELGRQCVDLWAEAIFAVARANPGRYLDWLDGRAPSTLDLVILGHVDDPRASTVLRGALGHPEWPHRHQAEESLARRGEKP